MESLEDRVSELEGVALGLTIAIRALSSRPGKTIEGFIAAMTELAAGLQAQMQEAGAASATIEMLERLRRSS
jgi:hypothetical protein